MPFDDEVERDVERRLARALGDLEGASRSCGSARRRRPSGSPSPTRRRARSRRRSSTRSATAVRSGENLIAEAPTGSGKTAAALHPALAEGLAAGPPGRLPDLQDAPAEDGRLRPRRDERAGVPHASRSAPRSACAPTTGSSATRTSAGSPRTTRRRWSARTSSGACATLLAPRSRTPSSRRRAARRSAPSRCSSSSPQRADAIVADYNYVFEPAAALRHLTGEDLREAILLIDEAHNLPDRARQIFSPEILEEDLAAPAQPPRSSSRASSSRTSPISVEELLEILDAAGRGAARGRGDRRDRAARPSAIFDLRAALGSRSSCATSPGSARRASRSWTIRSSTSTSRCSASRPCSRCFGPDFTCVVERRPDGRPARRSSASIRRAPSRRSSGRRSSTILLSATLTPPEAIQRVLGLEPRPHVLDLAAAAVSAREPQGPDRAVRAHDLHGAGEELRPDRDAARRDVRRARRQRPRPLPLVPLPDGGRRAHAADALAPARPAARPDRLRAAAAARGARRRRRRAGRCSSPSRAACTPRASTIRASCSRRSSSSRRPCRRSPSSGSCCAATSTSKEEAGFDYAYLQPGHDARRAGRGPAHPQRDRPRRDRARSARASSRSPTRAACRATGTTRRPRELATRRPADEIREFFARYRMKNPVHEPEDAPPDGRRLGPRPPGPRPAGPAAAARRFSGTGGCPAASASGRRRPRSAARARRSRRPGCTCASASCAACTRRPDRDPRGHNVTVLYAATPRPRAGPRAATTRRRRAGSRRARCASSDSRSTTARSCWSSSRGIAGGPGAAEVAEAYSAFSVAAKARASRPSLVTAHTV